MKFMDFGCFKTEGELYKRMILSQKRMLSDHYNPDLFLTEEFVKEADWPGDTEGRLLLALAMLFKALGEKSDYVRAYFEKILSFMNEDGYLGAIIDENNINEQSLSGNSWLMRGICEYYEWTKDERAYAAVENMAKGLFLKTLHKYRHYPIETDMRLQNTGAESGSLTGQSVMGWLPSTDIGCAYIMMDGASHAYRILKWDALYDLLSEMIETFSVVDLKKCAFQTHASLSCARGMLRAGIESGREEWKKEAIRQFDFYIENGITENYENLNWYTRPEWTEPCAIIDSFILASEIWRLTGDEKYLHLAHRILYNAVYRSQRENGGFGCDNCVGADGKALFVRTYEAWWCCSMRGGDGLSNVARTICAVDGEKICLPFYHAGAVNLPGFAFKIDSEYPYRGKIAVSVVSSDEREREIALYKPEGALDFSVSGAEIIKEENGFAFVKKAFKAGDVIEVGFDFKLEILPAREKTLPDAKTILYGNLYLGTNAQADLPCPDIKNLTLTDPKRACFEDKYGAVYAPISLITFESEETIQNSRVQMIF
ncbi:MAG: glycoside hydrolase family 127 protein [Clostridia bacterium]|nr:glycoside hydrolase family 127 protein [Clostridia bacterium]